MNGAPKTVLIVEDDESIALGVKMNLEAEGYRVETAGDGLRGFERSREGEFDLILLDVMLPRENGFEVLRRLRAANDHTPVIMLTARGQEEEKVMGLELGAEDYITKPFGLAELLARIKVVLRRGQVSSVPVAAKPLSVTAGDLEIDAKSRQVQKSGQALSLTATEFDVLWCLVEAEGQVLSRQDIQVRVWGPEHHGTLRTIDNFLLQLRSKLEDDPGAPHHLLTVRGVGYRFAR